MTGWKWPDEGLWPTLVAAYLIEHGWIGARDAPGSARPMTEVWERPEPCVLRAVICETMDEGYFRFIDGYGFTMSDELRARLDNLLDYADPDDYPPLLLEEVRAQCPFLLLTDREDDEGAPALAAMDAAEARRALLAFPGLAGRLVRRSLHHRPLPFDLSVQADLLYGYPDTSPIILSAWRSLPGGMLERALQLGVNGADGLACQLKSAELEGCARNQVRQAVDDEMRRRRAAVKP